MSKEVMLRKSGNSLIFTAPSNLTDSVGEKYTIHQKEDGTVIYSPVKHENIFESSKFKNYDFQADLKNIPEA
ncbi:hypothetical protein M5C72_01780 [Companilactobacillus allii]|uniref:AbrB family transcriptional regulator n=1 Tax=Companilactobacillus allii TaxID=1847728 RepID=A0A1P8Q1Z0_9LACO|nr:hypothetical protein [Companilactobacillus allii]APX71894.1 hypothetical protein BTM29_04695 [Companilactobacillus allii]USQ68988.1 hypothetical protein M5C72_01780 [Companilactobacillus allii]